MFLRLYRLVETVAVATSEHHTAGELIDKQAVCQVRICQHPLVFVTDAQQPGYSYRIVTILKLGLLGEQIHLTDIYDLGQRHVRLACKVVTCYLVRLACYLVNSLWRKLISFTLT